MKRMLRLTGGLLGVLALAGLVVALVMTFQGLRGEPQAESPMFQSPIETPTPLPSPPATPSFGSPTPSLAPTISPTPTMWKPTPRPTPIRPGGPTPTPLPLPTPAADASGNIWFIAASTPQHGAVQQRLFYVPMNRVGRPESSKPIAFSLPEYKWSAQGMPRLYPSPRGRYLAVIGASGPLDQITIVDLVDHRLLPFYPPRLGKVLVFGRFGGWHPDGRHILYIGSDNRTGLWLVDVENEQSPQYLSEHTPDSAAFSPDGQRLVFAGPMVDVSGDKPIALNALWLAQADGSHERKIFETSNMVSIFGLSWSPDGSKFIYIKGGAEIWVADADGTNRRLLGRNYASGWGFPPPVWSPDGRVIAFLAQEVPVDKGPDAYSTAGAFRYVNIRLIDVLTGEERRLIPDSHVGNMYPAWSPDGSMVAFLSNQSGNPEIWIATKDDSYLRQLTHANARYSAPVWVSRKGGK